MVVPFMVAIAMLCASSFGLWAFIALPKPELPDDVFVSTLMISGAVAWLVTCIAGIVAGFGGIIVTTSQKSDGKGHFVPRENAYGRAVGSLITSLQIKSLCGASAFCGIMGCLLLGTIAAGGFLIFLLATHPIRFAEAVGVSALFGAAMVALAFGALKFIELYNKSPIVQRLTMVAGVVMGVAILFFLGRAVYMAGPPAAPDLSGADPRAITVPLAIACMLGIVAGSVYLLRKLLEHTPLYSTFCPSPLRPVAKET